MNRALSLCLLSAFLLSCGQVLGNSSPSPSAPSAAEPALQPANLSLAEVLKRHLAARGGREALLAVKTLRMSGKMTNSEDVADAPITIDRQRQGGKFSRRLVTGGTTVIQAVDGGKVWEVDPGMNIPKPVPMEGRRANRFRRWTDIEGPLVDYQAKGHQVTLLGRQKLPSGDVYRLKVQYKDGDVAYFLIDAKTFLLDQVIDVVSQGRPYEVQTVYADFRKVGGLVWPFDEKTSLPTLSQHFAWSQIEANVPIDDAEFKMPG